MNQIAILSVGLFLPFLATTDDNSKAETENHRIQIHGQSTLILQNELPFHSPYQGANSFQSRRQTELSDTYTIYLGVRLKPNLDFYLNPEMARGGGLSDALGIAGYINGDVIRNPSLSQSPYIGRGFIRYWIQTGKGSDHQEDGINQIAGDMPNHRLVLTAGKFGSNDIFDTNRYAGNTRTQFMNWDLINNAAYDYAADTRGYTMGISAEWFQPTYIVRLGTFQMPSVANGIQLDGRINQAHGDQVEVETHPHLISKATPATLRLLGYRNVARMGDYEAALQLGTQTHTPPDITLTRQDGRVKYGFGASFEQPLNTDGTTGIFARAGWNDGATESFAYTEAEQSLSIGLQITGRQWHRPNDVFAVALAQNGLSKAHRNYLEAGGSGFILGDGKLSYGPEQLLEAYYNYSLGRGLTLGPDIQIIQNPGYNHDRGPVPILGFRLHAEF
jgi:hypothetical protein